MRTGQSRNGRVPVSHHPRVPRVPAEAMPVRHRNVQRGTIRAAVFGASDGLTTNVSLILGVAAATPTASFVRLAGIAGLLAGAFSMATGEYLSMRTQTELFEHELDREAGELRARPDYERRELANMYQRHGLPRDLAERVAVELMRDPKQALEAHAREELGIRTDQLGAPAGAAGSSFASFAIGALIPLLPWFFITGTGAILASVFAGAAASIAIGTAVGFATGRSSGRAALRQLGFTAIAAGTTFLVGRIVGIQTT
jgi:VIT1/CCC1 family predicted Fe2+/Mn2+ transporter